MTSDVWYYLELEAYIVREILLYSQIIESSEFIYSRTIFC
jgi:hypothetical protein